MLQTSCVYSTGLMFGFGITSGGGTYFYGYYSFLSIIPGCDTPSTTMIEISSSSAVIVSSFFYLY